VNYIFVPSAQVEGFSNLNVNKVAQLLEACSTVAWH